MLHLSKQDGQVVASQVATVCAFAGAHHGHDNRFAAATATLGRAIGMAGLRLVYGGGDAGLMGCVARAAWDHGSEVIAVTPRFFTERAGWSSAFGQQIIVPDMHMRKRLMFEYADAFIALPGGIGTIEELSEVMTLGKLDRHSKPILLANFGGFWAPWLDLLDHLADAGFTSVRERCRVVDEPSTVLAALDLTGPASACDAHGRKTRRASL